MTKGYLALVLHAHLPFVRHPEHEDALEERWFYDAITQCYLPLLFVMEELEQEGIDFRFTLSITPTLGSMLSDRLLLSRYSRRLDALIELGEQEITRTATAPEQQKLARLYHTHLLRVRQAFAERYQGDLLAEFFRWQKKKNIEIIASCATHGYLPLLAVDRSAVFAQIKTGIDWYQQQFGENPTGFWLPECGFYPGGDELLAGLGIRYTFNETHGVTRATPRPRFGVYAPVACPTGLAVFGRDPDSSRQVWSSNEGYPGDPDYREYYRDIGHELDPEYLRPYIHRDGIRVDTGYKYFRITGPGMEKELYDPDKAAAKADLHALDFLKKKEIQLHEIAPHLDRPPIIVAPFDAELFGHWWHEGPIWLGSLFRNVARQSGSLRCATIPEYLAEYPADQQAMPASASWGKNGFHETWLNPANDWIYPHLHQAVAIIQDLLARFPEPSPLVHRALVQAARELLLAQASDWAFMIHGGTTVEYAKLRLKRHLSRFLRLSDMIGAGEIDSVWLAQIEGQEKIFPEIDYRIFGR
jgi:1,4-alpha-glucan branching enzyme